VALQEQVFQPFLLGPVTPFTNGALKRDDQHFYQGLLLIQSFLVNYMTDLNNQQGREGTSVG